MRNQLPRFLLALTLLLILTVTALAQGEEPPSLALLPYDSEDARVQAQALPLTPLARLPLPTGEEWLLASLPPAVARGLGAPNLNLGPLDPSAGPLWLIEYSPDITPGLILPDLAAFGRLLWQQEPYILLQALPDRAETLSNQGLRLIPLDTPIRLTAPISPFTSPALAADPVIASIIARLNAAAITTWDRRLSGEDPVIIGGASFNLRSRYSPSTNGRLSEQYVFEQLQRLGYAPRYFNYTTPYGGNPWRNISADLPGQTAPSRLVLLIGHLDSISYPLGNAGAQAPGGDDNASGSASLLAMADILRGERFAYTLRFVWFTGEEQGHWGSLAYARALANQGVDVLAAINLDMIGYDGNRDRVLELHTGTDAPNIRLGDYLAAANQLYSLGLNLERKTTTASRFSDHSSFWDSGYASLLVIENFFDDAAPYNRPRDRNPAYHQPTDRINLVDFAYVTAIARMGLAAALHLAVPLPSGATPTPTFTPSPTPASGCSERLSNGGFETNTAWSFGSTARPAGYTTAAAHTGARSLRTGIVPPTANTRAHSSAYQAVALPASASSLTLDLWLKGNGGDANDYSEILLLDANRNLLRLLWRGDAGSNWAPRSFDLSTYAGRTVHIYLNTYNDGAGSVAWAYFDDISLRACSGPAAVTSTPTPTPTPTATATEGIEATPTPSLTPTSSPTPTATATATSTSEATATPTPASTATPTPTPFCREGVNNGGFESDSGWNLPNTANRAGFTNALAHTGLRSLRLGLLPGALVQPAGDGEQNLLGELAPTGAAYSTAYQLLHLPADAASLTLTWWQQPGSAAAAGDWQRALLLQPGSFARIAELQRFLRNDAAWTQATFDLTPYRGRDVILYFEVYNNDTGPTGRTWLFLDDVSLLACPGPAAAALGPALYLPLLQR